ncbi:hypothetical protein D3C78_1220060 [compost metagenome]
MKFLGQPACAQYLFTADFLDVLGFIQHRRFVDEVRKMLRQRRLRWFGLNRFGFGLNHRFCLGLCRLQDLAQRLSALAYLLYRCNRSQFALQLGVLLFEHLSRHRDIARRHRSWAA